jgi:hypothetical protein
LLGGSVRARTNRITLSRYTFLPTPAADTFI